jgi:large subunit ribosomal protein L1
MKISKKVREYSSKIDRLAEYPILDGIMLTKKYATAKFDESVEVAVSLGVNPKFSDQMIRGSVTLPHGTGKTVRVLVLAKGAKAEEAEAAHADYVGFEEYIEKLKQGWTDVDVVITTPDNMGEVGKLGRVLGPRGLMPNPKSGTVTMDVAAAVEASKAGKIDFRSDKYGNVHSIVGKVSFDAEKLSENLSVLLKKLIAMKPSSSKGLYVKRVTISSTMGPGIKIDKAGFSN